MALHTMCKLYTIMTKSRSKILKSSSLENSRNKTELYIFVLRRRNWFILYFPGDIFCRRKQRRLALVVDGCCYCARLGFFFFSERHCLQLVAIQSCPGRCLEERLVLGREADASSTLPGYWGSQAKITWDLVCNGVKADIPSKKTRENNR